MLIKLLSKLATLPGAVDLKIPAAFFQQQIDLTWKVDFQDQL